MQEITVVKRRSRLGPILLAILLVALMALAALWFMGDRTMTDFGSGLLGEPATAPAIADSSPFPA